MEEREEAEAEAEAQAQAFAFLCLLGGIVFVARWKWVEANS